jgi:hypothetical protein
MMEKLMGLAFLLCLWKTALFLVCGQEALAASNSSGRREEACYSCGVHFEKLVPR